MLLEGIFTAATTCFNSDGKLFLHKLERNVERYSRTAISGIVILGSTGEAVMLSDDESRSVLQYSSAIRIAGQSHDCRSGSRECHRNPAPCRVCRGT